jgi:hypothetical protein
MMLGDNPFDDEEPAREDKPQEEMRVSFDVPDGVKLVLIINGVEMVLDD